MRNAYLLMLPLFALSSTAMAQSVTQPKVVAHKAKIITVDGKQFKDLNKNGKLDPYEDWRLPDTERIKDLIGKMTVEEKVGLLFHPNIAVPADGVPVYDSHRALSNEAYAGPIGPGGNTANGKKMRAGQEKDGADIKTYIVERNFRCILNNGIAEPSKFASWSNAVQEYAEASRLGIPVMFSTDPRNGASLGAHVSGKQYFSKWPSKEGQIGITAARDLPLMRKFGEAVAQEYRAVGLHMILGPQIDVITEPRWGRDMGCFSEDADLTSESLAAFMDGAQGDHVGQQKILVHLKHWPGAGPHAGGKGDWIIYPGNNRDYHLIPWRTGIAHNALAAMSYYSGTYVDTLAVSYSPYWENKVLRDELGFKGAVCTDWGVVSMKGPLRKDVQNSSLKDRMAMVINAGVDQMGSETDADLMVQNVREGKVSEARLNEAASRILQWHFALGLFENPYVDADKADSIVNNSTNRANAYQAQLESIILLTNEDKTLPLKKNQKIYVEGVDSKIASQYADVVSDPKDADIIIYRNLSVDNSKDPIQQLQKKGLGVEEMQKEMTKIFAAQANTPVDISYPSSFWDRVKELSATGKPVVFVVNPTGSEVVLPKDLKTVTKASLMVFDISDNALMDVITGKFNPVGKLPFEIPASMQDVKEQKEDVPFDSPHKAFPYGWGLSY